MSVIAVCGLPGSGKTLLTTYFMLKHYKKMNRLKSKKKKVNCIYTNFPVKLDKEHYSKPIGLWDINLQHSWEPNSVIGVDEVQLYIDSLDFKDFPKSIRNTFQLHRHFGISDIYLDTQHPSRMVKQLRILCSKFIDVVGFTKIPFTPFAIFHYNIYYNYEDFGKSVKVNKSDVSYKFSKRFLIMNYKKVFKSYDTIYMNNLVSDKPKFNSPEFISKLMSKDDIDSTFGINDEDDEDIKKKPKRAEKGKKQGKSEASSFQDSLKSSSSKDTESIDTASILIEATEEFKNSKQDKSSFDTSESLEEYSSNLQGLAEGFNFNADKQAESLHENDFIKWSPVGDEPTTDVFSLIDDIEKNDSNDNNYFDSTDKKASGSSFWD